MIWSSKSIENEIIFKIIFAVIALIKGGPQMKKQLLTGKTNKQKTNRQTNKHIKGK